MRLPRNTDLPQPTAPSPLASLSLILAWTVLFTRHASTAKENSISHEGHNHPQLNGALEVDAGHDLETYEPEFTGADRSIIGRAGEVSQTLGNNAPGIRDISQGASHYWSFPNATLFGPKTPQAPGLPSYFKGQNVSAIRDDPSEVELYISLTTCRLPLAKDPNSDSVPNQLKLYVSTSSTNQQPDENKYDHAVPVEGGFGWLNISTKNGVYFGVYAPANEDYDGVYNYQLTASIDGFYASSYSDPNFKVHFVDSDINSALLYTTNLNDTTNTSDPVFQQWMGRSQVFSLFLQNTESPSILGLQNSVCGLQNLAQIQASDVEYTMTAAGDGLPKQQIHVKNLKRNSTYNAILAMIGNSTDQGRGVVGGGGTVWNSANLTNFTTKSCWSLNISLFLLQSLTALFQSKIALFSSTCPFAPRLHTQLRLILKPIVQQNFSPNMTFTPKVSMRTSRTRSNKFRATRHPLLSILSPEIATIATPPTNSGFARSLYPDARISPTMLLTCSLGRSFMNPSTHPTQFRILWTRQSSRTCARRSPSRAVAIL